MKTSELTGAALDWAVGHALRLAIGRDYEIVDGVPVTGETIYTREGLGFDEIWSPSTNWEQGGPLIQREWLHVEPWPNSSIEDRKWSCTQYELATPVGCTGPTPLIAAMRCYTISKLGEEVDVPEELK